MSESQQPGTSSPIALAQARLAQLRAEGAVENLDPLERSARNPGSLALAVKAMCYECMGRDEPGARADIAACDHWDCPLWQFRPHQSSAPEGHGAEQRARWRQRCESLGRTNPLRSTAVDPGSRRKAVNAKCVQCMGGTGEVSYCTSPFPMPDAGDGFRGCPLYPHRPYQQPTAQPFKGHLKQISDDRGSARPTGADEAGASVSGPQTPLFDAGASDA